MLKKLAAIGLGAALILAPVASMAQTSTDTTTAPAAGTMDKTMKPAPKKHTMKKHVVKKHVVKKHKVKKAAPKKMDDKAAPAPAADAPKS